MIYRIENFDRNNFGLLRSIIGYFTSKYDKLKIEIWNEQNGFPDVVEIDSLMAEIDRASKEYTGLDEITLSVGERFTLSVVFHEDMMLVDVDDETLKIIRDKFKLTLVEFKVEEKNEQ